MRLSDINRARIEGIGWAHADACADLDVGIDPRKKDMAEMLERAKKDLGFEKGITSCEDPMTARRRLWNWFYGC